MGRERKDEIKGAVLFVKQLSPIVSLTKMMIFEQRTEEQAQEPRAREFQKGGREQ